MSSIGKEFIFIKLLLPYLLGLVVALLFPSVPLLWPIGLVLLLVSVLLFFVHRAYPALSSRNQWAALIYGWLMYVGLLNTLWANPTLGQHHYSHSAHTPGIVLLQMEDAPVEKGIYYQAIGKVVGHQQAGNLNPTTGRVLLQLPMDSLAGKLVYGDIIAVNARFEPIPPPQNPYEFDYSNYLAQKHIYHQLQPKPSRWYHTGTNTGQWFYTFIYTIRDKALIILQEHLQQPEHYAVASAMLLGYRGAMTPEVRQRYTLTGSMHVLAVSGMHVGFLYLILGWVLLPMRYFNRVWLRLAILLSVIWLYAFLTGLSPSVLRATLMFSLFAIGQSMQRPYNSLNLLAASALLILLWEPMQLLDVGFQLSYLAVLGILFFYRPLANLWPIKNRFLRFLWQGTCISVAAQVATLPLVVYYFHQIPLYALLANLGMLLLAPAVMIAGLVLLTLHWIPALGWLLGKALYVCVWLMDGLLGFVAALPNAVWKALYPTPTEMALWLGIVVAVMIATRMRIVRPLMVAALLLLVYLGVNNVRLYGQKLQQALVVYQYTDHTAIAEVSGQNSMLMGDSIVFTDTAKLERSIYPYLHANGAETPAVNILPAPKTDQYGIVGMKRFALIQKYTRRNLPQEKLAVDYLIISQTPSLNMMQAQWVYDARHIVFDGSNNAAAVARWMQECRVLGLDCHSTREGAFIASW